MSQEADDVAKLVQEEEDARYARELYAEEQRRHGSASSAILGGVSPYASPPPSSSSSGNSRQRSGSRSRKLKNPLLGISEMLNAITSSPGNDDGSESNGSLLYVPCEINNRPCEMMVDSGSQTSVMSSPMMRKLNLHNRLDTRYQGMAAGVGSARILGRIDNCPVKVGGEGIEFKLYFLVLDVPHDMMILGVDQLRRFKCLIDVGNNVLIFGGQGGLEVAFLPPDPNHADARDQCAIS